MSQDHQLPGALYLRTLGDAALLRSEASDEVLLEPSKLLALVVYLVFSPGRTATRDGLIDLLWSELDPDAGRHALRQHLWQLRRRLGADLFVEGRDQLTLNTPIDSDRALFVAASERSEFRRAVQLYTGDFFPGFAASGAGEFERWVDTERTELRARFLRCADMVVKDLLNSHHAKEAVVVARRVRAAEPLRQHGWRLLLESLLAAGDVLTASLECESLERMATEEELSLEPATRSLMATVLRASLPRRGGDTPRSLHVELVGREREFAVLVDAWERARRKSTVLVRVEGPAGLGKTRLLREFQARLDSMQARSVMVRGNAGSTGVPFSLASDLAEKLGMLPGARAVSPQSLRILVALCPALSSAFNASPHLSSTADLSRHRLSAVRELVAAVASERPLAILIDDLHWADQASRTLLAALHGTLPDASVLFCVSSRQAATDLGPSTGPAAILLGPLGESSVLSLLSSVASLPAEPWADRLVGTLHRLSRGVPLYIVEAMQLALQEGLLEIREGNWFTPDSGRLWRLFESGEVLLRRISTLDAAELRLLRTLACAAHPLPEDVALRAGTDSGTSGNAALTGLIYKGLVHSTGGSVAIAHDEMGALVLAGIRPEDQSHLRRELGRALAQGSDSDPQRHRFAAAQFRATGSERDLSALFSRYVSAARRRNDHRSARTLASELLGDSASETEARSLARSLSIPARVRAFGFTRAAAVAGLTFGVVGSAIGITALAWGSDNPPPEYLLQVETLDSVGTFRIYQVRLPDESSASLEPLVIRRRNKPILTPRARSRLYVPQPGVPNRWATVRDMPDSGQAEIILAGAGQDDERLTFARGDDVNPDWSPDGESIAFATSRWDSLGHTDIGIIARSGGPVRQVTRGHSSDEYPHWSPDGTRLTFPRSHFSHRRFESCVATVDGIEVLCRAHSTRSQPIGWLDDSSFAVNITNEAGNVEVQVLAVASESLTVTASFPFEAKAVSPHGTWWITRCSTVVPASLCLLPQGNAARPRRIMAETGDIVSVRFARTRPGDHVTDIAVRNRHAIARVGVPFAIDAIAVTASGGSRVLRSIRVRSLDDARATMDAHQAIIGKAPGPVQIEVSAAGWRTDTVTLSVAAPEDRQVLQSTWDTLTGWEPFGEPLPETVPGETGGRALHVAGDGVYHSGVRSIAPVHWSAGIHIRTRLSTPINRRQWQYLAVAFFSTQKPGPPPAWDSRAGYVWSPGGLVEECALYIPPPTEGEFARDSIYLTGDIGGPVRAPSIVASGAWYSLVFQLFPDGRCGAAINGEPIAMSRPKPIRPEDLYVSFFGNSVGTKMLVGETTVSIGVAKDIDWGRLLHN